MDKAYPYKRLKDETALGATKVLEALRKAQIPVVVHNGLHLAFEKPCETASCGKPAVQLES